MTYINCPQCAQSFNAERDLTALRAQLAAVTTMHAQWVDLLRNQTEIMTTAQRNTWADCIAELGSALGAAALMEGTTE